MMKIRYNAETGKVINAYDSSVIVPQPYIELETETWNALSPNKDMLYVIGDEVVDITGTEKDLELKAREIAKDLTEQLYQLKASVAYGGITVNNAYVFETNATSILMTTTTYQDLINNPNIEYVENWKCYNLAGEPIFLSFTREQFIQIKEFATRMVNDSFAVEGSYNIKLQNATVKELTTPLWVMQLQAMAIRDMKAIDTTLDLGDIKLGK